MLPSRYVPGQTSAIRKSRLEGKPSMLPKPRRPGSTDRLSTEARRPSTTGHRSSSAEPPRATFGGGRLSREASATKLPISGRSRSQQSERFGQSAATPLQSSHYSRPTTTPVRSRSQQSERFGQSATTPLQSSNYSRPTTTPVRTPSEDRATRNWQVSLERALSFVTVKDQRPISSVAWQRGEYGRVAAALAARGAPAFMRPLTIARFVDTVGGLLAALTRDAKLNSDNYVTKLPHLTKRLLYPGTVSKSWLKTVNTLHAFPHALALIAYLLDLVNHIETPISDDWLYVGKDDLALLRRDYLHKCWIRFQDPEHQFEDLNEEYLLNLKGLLGYDEEKVAQLQNDIKKREECLEDEEEAAARAEEQRLLERRDGLAAALRAERAARAALRAQGDQLRATRGDHAVEMRQLDQDIERLMQESQQLREELETQGMTVEERARLLDEVDYALRVQDSKGALAHQVAKMLQTKENELALWQKKTLDSCVEYKQGLIHLSAQYPEIAKLAIDEKELMGSETATRVCAAVETVRGLAARLAATRADLARSKSAKARLHAAQMEETRAKIAELKSAVVHEQQALDAEIAQENAEVSAWSEEERQLTSRMEELNANKKEYAEVEGELEFWDKQDAGWRSKLSEMNEYIDKQTAECQRALEAARTKRVKLIEQCVREWNTKLVQ